MAQTLESIRGGGGSIKVGTTGTIGALMSRELDSIKPALCRNKAPTDSASITPGASNKKAFKSKPQANEASSSNRNNGADSISREIIRKAKHYNGKGHQTPMLDFDNISVDGTPIRQKPDKRLSYMVDVADIKCGSPEKLWVNPITNRLKKLGFSKLSQSII